MLKQDRIYADRIQAPFIRLVKDRVVREQDDPVLEWVLDPPFQRGAVWTLAQKQAWWETILLNLPTPAIFINRFGHYTSADDGPLAGPAGYEHREVIIDGQQRIRATAEFLRNEYPVRGEYWGDQDQKTQLAVLNNFICPVYYTRFDTLRECAELYLKLLTTGTAHTPEEIAKARAFLEAS